MKCAKCGSEIPAPRCQNCGFDHSAANICFLTPLTRCRLEVCAPLSDEDQSLRNILGKTLTSVLQSGYSKVMKEKTTFVADGKFEIFDGVLLRKYKGSDSDVIVPSYIKSIGNSAFRGNALCTTIDLPKGIVDIGSCAFENCVGLKSINLTNGLKCICPRAFANCRQLRSIQIPGTVELVCPGAFSNCTMLESVDVQEGVRELDMGIFRGCSNLKQISIPDSMEAITGRFEGNGPVRIVASKEWIADHGNCFLKNPNLVLSAAAAMPFSGA